VYRSPISCSYNCSLSRLAYLYDTAKSSSHTEWLYAVIEVCSYKIQM